jgi:predicted permease
MGGDARLMAGILTTQTALAIITLPIWISLLGS